MGRVCIESRGIGNWRERLADPERQWRREYSAFETAVSWELAARTTRSGLPPTIHDALGRAGLRDLELAFAIAEHKVALDGRGGDSQCDVWALVKSSEGLLSLCVEAKAKEEFGSGHQPLGAWLHGGKSAASADNRQQRWVGLSAHLPASPVGYQDVAFQLLHRCAAAVIEARRFGLRHAAFVVQAFGAPDTSFVEFERLAGAMGAQAIRGEMATLAMGEFGLGIGWCDSPLATDADVASVAS